MSTVPELFGSHEEMRNSALDVLALLNACVRQDSDAVIAMLSTFQTEQERAQLTCGLLATAVSVLKVAACATGMDPGKFLAVAAQEVREES